MDKEREACERTVEVVENILRHRWRELHSFENREDMARTIVLEILPTLTQPAVTDAKQPDDVVELVQDLKKQFTNCDVGQSWAAKDGYNHALKDVVAVLKKHHEWHLSQGQQLFPLDDIGGTISLDMAAEYADSSLYEQTEAVLWALPQSKMSEEEIVEVLLPFISTAGRAHNVALRLQRQKDKAVKAARAILAASPQPNPTLSEWDIVTVIISELSDKDWRTGTLRGLATYIARALSKTGV